MGIETAVGLFIFNRPETTGRVFDAIARARPQRLLVVADGPRQGHPDDLRKCAAARAVVERVDWPCDVKTNFSDANLGCGRRMASGLDWVFGQSEQAIILEDDCVPGPSFFRFCEEMLDRYRNDERIMHVSGNNFQLGAPRGDASYFFCRMAHIWGWASWRRAWRGYDYEVKGWPEFRGRGGMRGIFRDERAARYWTRILDRMHRGPRDTWDYQWSYAIWSHGGLAICPWANLVANIGGGPDSTHTFDQTSPIINMPIVELGPLVHPRDVVSCDEADEFYFSTIVLPQLKWNLRRIGRLPINAMALLRQQWGRTRRGQGR